MVRRARDDPEFGHRLLADEARDADEAMADRTAWRITSSNGWWSTFGKRRRGKGGKAGRPVHDDLVERDFTAAARNRLWLTDITEHNTGESMLYLCAIKDVFSGKIVGYSIDSRMKSHLAVNALRNAVAMRGDVAGCVIHSDGGSQFRSRKFLREIAHHRMAESMGHVGAAGDNAAMESSFSPCCRRTSSTAVPGPPARNCGSRSSPGSSGPTTGAAGNPVWAV